jgi:hypothetical protein
MNRERGGGAYSYIRVLPDGFLLKAIVFTVCENEYIPPPLPIIIASSYGPVDLKFYNEMFRPCALLWIRFECLRFYMISGLELDWSMRLLGMIFGI